MTLECAVKLWWTYDIPFKRPCHPGWLKVGPNGRLLWADSGEEMPLRIDDAIAWDWISKEAS